MAEVARGATDARPVRITYPLAGIGGFLAVEWASRDDPKPGAGDKLEVERWEIEHDLRDVELPLSGGEGAMSVRRVADSFGFTAIVAVDLNPLFQRNLGNSFVGQALLDGRLEGEADKEALFHIGVRFQCGDPTSIGQDSTSIARPVADNEGLFYFCPRVLLTQTRTLDSSKGDPPDGVVRSIVRGKGSAPLERYFNDLTTPTGRGGLGFA